MDAMDAMDNPLSDENDSEKGGGGVADSGPPTDEEWAAVREMLKERAAGDSDKKNDVRALVATLKTTPTNW
jgi:hypothetical protein|eukprot:COSAG06_NODE_6062_length_3130_cov_2.108545_5_plen_71_part_00